MPRIRVIVGSSIDVWDDGVRTEMDRYRSEDTVLEVVHLASGPESIEDAVGDVRAAGPMFESVLAAEDDGCDAAIIYCFGDPGLRAAKIAVDIPVVGLGEASSHLAALLADRFGIITAGPVEARTRHLLHENLVASRLDHLCVGVETIGVPVLGLADVDETSEVERAVECGHALAAAGAECIVLGCGSILGVEDALTAALGMPIVVPAAAALKMAELMLALGLSNCRLRTTAR